MEPDLVNLNRQTYRNTELSRCGCGRRGTRRVLLSSTRQLETRQQGTNEQQTAHLRLPEDVVGTIDSEKTQFDSLTGQRSRRAQNSPQSQNAIIAKLQTKREILSCALDTYKMRVKIANSEQMKTQAALKSTSRSVEALESAVETLWVEQESVKRASEEIIRKWLESAK